MSRPASKNVKRLVLEALASGPVLVSLLASAVQRDEREVRRARSEVVLEGLAHVVAGELRGGPGETPGKPSGESHSRALLLKDQQRNEQMAAAAAPSDLPGEIAGEDRGGESPLAELARANETLSRVVESQRRELHELRAALEGRVSPRNEPATALTEASCPVPGVHRDVKPEKFHRELTKAERDLVRAERVAEERSKGEIRPEHLERVAEKAVEDCRSIPDRFERYERSARRRADALAEKKAQEERWALEKAAQEARIAQERADRAREPRSVEGPKYVKRALSVDPREAERVAQREREAESLRAVERELMQSIPVGGRV